MKFLMSKILSVKDDAHIGDILKSKFTNFSNFHTKLYTCAVEFDFMEAAVSFVRNQGRVNRETLITCTCTVYSMKCLKGLHCSSLELRFKSTCITNIG